MGRRAQLAQAYYDLATMLDAGLPILRCFDVAIEGRRGRFKQVLARIRESLSKGSTLSESMEEHPRLFGDLDRTVIEAAEASGSIGQSFRMLSQWYEFVLRLTRRIQAGLIYPFFILHIAALIGPFPPLVLGQSSVGEYVLGVLGILSLIYVPTLFVLAMLRLKTVAPILRPALDSLVLRIPVLGPAVFHLSVCRYARAFGMLYQAGVPIVECTRRAVRATGNVAVARRFAGGAAKIAGGGVASEGFSKRLPSEYLHLWQVGEETGELDKMADKIAQIAGDRADLYFTEFARWLPRIVYFAIMALLAAMVLQMAGQVWGGSGVQF